MSREIVHIGRRIRVAVDTLTTAAGLTVRRDLILHPGAVVILPVLDAERVVLILGRESTGLPEELLARHADRVVHLPMRDDALRSLNVSTTAGIAMFEVLRQWEARA